MLTQSSPGYFEMEVILGSPGIWFLLGSKPRLDLKDLFPFQPILRGCDGFLLLLQVFFHDSISPEEAKTSITF